MTLIATNYKQVREINIFALVLVVQSLPFLAAVAIAAIEGTLFNSSLLAGRRARFAYVCRARKSSLRPRIAGRKRVEAAQ